MAFDPGVVTLLLISVDRTTGAVLRPSDTAATSAAGGSVVLRRRQDDPDGCLVGMEFPLAMDATRTALRVVARAPTAARVVVCTRQRPVDGCDLRASAEILRAAPAGQVVVNAAAAVLIGSALPHHIELVPCRTGAPDRPRWSPEQLYRLRCRGAETPAEGGLHGAVGRRPSAASDLVWARRAVPSPLVGRDPTTKRLWETWRAALAGCRRTVLVTGERGGGKTAQVADLALAAQARGGQVLYGRPDHGPGSLDQALRAAVGDGTGNGDHDCLRTRLDALADHDCLRTRLDALAEHGPVLLVLDDVRWDPDLRRLVDAVAQPAAGAPWMLAVTVRPGPPQPHQRAVPPVWPTGWAATPDVEHVALGGIDVGGVEALVGQRHDIEAVPDEAAIAWLTSATAGNPLFVRTMLNAVTSRTSPATALMAMRERLPERVVEVVRWRLAPLPAPTRQALARVARGMDATGAVTVDHLASALAAAPVTVRAALDPAVDDDLLAHDRATGTYRFRHEVVWRALRHEPPVRPFRDCGRT